MSESKCEENEQEEKGKEEQEDGAGPCRRCPKKNKNPTLRMWGITSAFCLIICSPN